MRSTWERSWTSTARGGYQTAESTAASTSSLLAGTGEQVQHLHYSPCSTVEAGLMQAELDSRFCTCSFKHVTAERCISLWQVDWNVFQPWNLHSHLHFEWPSVVSIQYTERKTGVVTERCSSLHQTQIDWSRKPSCLTRGQSTSMTLSSFLMYLFLPILVLECCHYQSCSFIFSFDFNLFRHPLTMCEVRGCQTHAALVCSF